MSGQEYPKCMYRDGGDEMVWGKPVRTIIVHDRDEEEACRLDGWRLHPIPNPLDHDLDGKSGGSMPKRGRSSKPREGAE